MWTCGPFAEVRKNIEIFNFQASQTAKFQEILDELNNAELLIKSGTDQEKIWATMLYLDLENKLMLLIGGKDYVEETDNKISRKTISRLAKR